MPHCRTELPDAQAVEITELYFCPKNLGFPDWHALRTGIFFYCLSLSTFGEESLLAEDLRSRETGPDGTCVRGEKAGVVPT